MRVVVWAVLPELASPCLGVPDVKMRVDLQSQSELQT